MASTLVRPSTPGSSSASSYPLVDERTPAERYTWGHRGEFESDRELAELRQQNKRLGDAVTWVLETLNPQVDEQEGQEAWQVQRKQSLESLSYVRDILSGQINEIDERRLWGEEEFKRRWETCETSPSVATGGSGPARDSRRYALNTTIPSSVSETQRGFTSANAARAAISGASDHSRSASLGTPVTLRAPVRVSASNPFQRVSDVSQTQWSNRTGDASGDVVRNQAVVQRDPLGALR